VKRRLAAVFVSIALAACAPVAQYEILRRLRGRPDTGRGFPLRFTKGELMSAKLAGRFVECSRPGFD